MSSQRVALELVKQIESQEEKYRLVAILENIYKDFRVLRGKLDRIHKEMNSRFDNLKKTAAKASNPQKPR